MLMQTAMRNRPFPFLVLAGREERGTKILKRSSRNLATMDGPMAVLSDILLMGVLILTDAANITPKRAISGVESGICTNS